MSDSISEGRMLLSFLRPPLPPNNKIWARGGLWRPSATGPGGVSRGSRPHPSGPCTNRRLLADLGGRDGRPAAPRRGSRRPPAPPPRPWAPAGGAGLGLPAEASPAARGPGRRPAPASPAGRGPGTRTAMAPPETGPSTSSGPLRAGAGRGAGRASRGFRLPASGLENLNFLSQVYGRTKDDRQARVI